eukprot:188423_1
MNGPQRHKNGMKGGKVKMTRLRTVWITEPSKKPFKDNYQIIKQIGEPGQFGKAYQCKRKTDNKMFAVKQIAKARIYRLDPSDRIRQTFLKMMQDEITILRTLSHKYIVQMYETYETKHYLYIIMEECKGGELFDRIKIKKRYSENDAKIVIKK